MKRLFKNTFLALAALLASACVTKTETPLTDEPEVTVTSGERVVAGPDGGNFTVTYTVTNPVEGCSAELVCDADWVVDVAYPEDGSISFGVAANDSGELRETIAEIVYRWSETEEPATASFIVSQDAGADADVKNDCKYVSGLYYGDLYAMSGENMYYMNISDLGFKEDGTVYPDGAYYQLAFFADDEPSDVNSIELPDGIYNIGDPGATDAGTVSSDYSRYFISNSDGTNYAEGPFAVVSGSLAVSTDNGQKLIEGVITTDDGRSHYIYYRGETNIELYNLGYEPVDFDHSVDELFIGGANYVSSTADVMNITMTVTEKTGADGMMEYPSTVLYYDLYCPVDKYGIVPGTYSISDSGEAFTIPSGKIELVGGWESFEGAHMVIFEGDGKDKAALITGGTVTFEKEGNIYTMTADLVNIYGKKFEFTYTGEINVPNIPGDGFSTLTEDIVVDLTGATGFAAYWGDDYGTGVGRYDISLNSAEWGGESVFFDIAVEGLDFSAGIPSGTYKAASGDVPGAWEYVKGYQDERGVLWGTRYEGGYDDLGFINVCAPALSGELTIVNKGNEMYDVSFEFVDDKGYKWSGEWSGIISLVDFT